MTDVEHVVLSVPMMVTIVTTLLTAAGVVFGFGLRMMGALKDIELELQKKADGTTLQDVRERLIRLETRHERLTENSTITGLVGE